MKTAFEFVSSLITKDPRFNGENLAIDPFAMELSEWALRTYHDPPTYMSMRWTIIKSDILAENPYILDNCLKLLEEKTV